MLKSEVCLEALVNCNKKEIEGKEKPKDWKESETKMLEKKRKPTSKDVRPIALTHVSYKIFMAYINDETEDHLKENMALEESRAGFTEGGKIEDNLFILQYCVEESFKNKKKLIIPSIDFKKAFDSIKRETLIEVLKEYKIHPLIIDSIAKIYVGDITILDLGEGLEQEAEVTSGIRQGCTGSTTLFKLITYMMIKKINEGEKGFSNDSIKLGILFFAVI